MNVKINLGFPMLLVALLIVFLCLKVTKIITWPWLVTLTPLWLLILYIVVLIIMIVVATKYWRQN